MLYLTRKFGFALKHETQSWHCLCNFKSSSGSLPPLLGVSQGFIRRTWQCAVPSAPECTGTRVKAVQQQNLVFLHSCILWFWNLSNIIIIGLWQMCISTLKIHVPHPACVHGCSVSPQCQRKVCFKTCSEHGFELRGQHIHLLQRSPVRVKQHII